MQKLQLPAEIEDLSNLVLVVRILHWHFDSEVPLPSAEGRTP